MYAFIRNGKNTQKIIYRLDIIDGGAHIERDGQVNITQPAIWKWGYFDNPGEIFEFMNCK